MRNNITLLRISIIVFSFSQCTLPPGNVSQTAEVTVQPDTTLIVATPRISTKTIIYHKEKSKTWIKKYGIDSMLPIILAVNRTDSAHISKIDSIIVPDDVSGVTENYFPFPFNVPYLKSIPKIIFFSYPSQSFGAYEMGDLVYTGPVNMGRKKDPTPAGLYFTNWKAEKTTSTFNDEWDLRWNVNIDNKLGIGWHQYDLPGYPVSHSCLRLQEKDARYLYTWADEWIVGAKDSVMAQGIPVIVFGSYPFGSPKPWLQLVVDPHALDISPEEIERQTLPYISEIMAQQERRAGVVSR